MAIVVNSYVRWTIDSDHPSVSVNANSAMQVLSVDAADERGGVITVMRQGKRIGPHPTWQFTEVRAP